jgi:hypothetical protein
MMKCPTLPLLLLGLISASLASSIDVSGQISSAQTWNSDTVRVTGEVTIDNGITLTIAPGTNVEFQGHYSITIKGRILALGATTDTIVFTAKDTSEGWHGIRFDSTSSTNDTSRLSYCRLQYGRAGGSDDDILGGALFLRNFSKVAISHSIISHNSASGYHSYGGGMYCANASPVLTDVTISNNAGSGSGGGGIYCGRNAAPRLTDVTINNNRSDYGGGMCCDSSSPVLNRVTFTNNRAVQGLGMYCSYSSPSLTEVTFSKNCYNGGTVAGGGIYCTNHSSPSLKSVTFANNSCSWGGGMYCSSSSPVLVNVVFNSDTAGTEGAGMLCDGSSPLLINVAFLKNKSFHVGGGLYCLRFSSPRLINTTFCNNFADSLGGGMYCSSSSSPKLTNAIFWSNNSKKRCDEAAFGDTTSSADFFFCDIHNGKDSLKGPGAGAYYKGSYLNNLDADPLFTDTAAGIFSLQTGSPCINGGTADTAGLGLPNLDLAGNQRICNGRIDIGAYENQGSSVLIAASRAAGKTGAFLTNSPNPFSGQTLITFSLPPSSNTETAVRLIICTTQGKIIKELFRGNFYRRIFSIAWNGIDERGKSVPAGAYLCVLSRGDRVVWSKKILLRR